MPKERREVEFAALPHDVGKVRIPKEISKKPGKLTDEERAIINTHTIEGERMLKKVGGLPAWLGRSSARVTSAGTAAGIRMD
jgi:HD-GYP domain-containing protein (c-di-GMP phosphodiesterase class II)